MHILLKCCLLVIIFLFKDYLSVNELTAQLHIHIYILAEVPAFARGIPRTIKYKCAIIAHHERRAGEMPIIAHHERRAGEMPIIAHHERKAGEMPIIAHHERKAGEMPIIAHHERKAGEMPIIAHHERKAGEMPISAHHERRAGELPISSVFMTERSTIFTWINQ